MLANAWYLLLLSLFAGYFVLGGLDYGVGLLLAGEPDPAQRRRALTAIGPFFLSNEVWLIVALGVLFGAFPMIEGELISGYYPATATAAFGVVLVTVAVQLRSRPADARARAAGTPRSSPAARWPRSAGARSWVGSSRGTTARANRSGSCSPRSSRRRR